MKFYKAETSYWHYNVVDGWHDDVFYGPNGLFICKDFHLRNFLKQ